MLTRPRRRSQAHPGLLAEGEPLPVDFTNRVIYYVGRSRSVRDEAVGRPPDTRDAMGQFHRHEAGENRLIAMIGKADASARGDRIDPAPQVGLLMAVGGARLPVSNSIKSAKVLGLSRHGMVAIYEFDVTDMPVTVAVDSNGNPRSIPPDRRNVARRSIALQCRPDLRSSSRN
ncbi:fumarate hydratase C-terminal domain-containing protein [Streptomyces andamanensis]|uniref:Fumarate hydratase C-terminal domain-containing protein n=1 Tax=Streptomyces andamanensis TaxID=1565035 RepID=A0ABV8T8L1_9ACTN